MRTTLVIFVLCVAGISADELPTCYLPAMTGPCRASIPMFYYNGSQDDCQRFKYGGCGGNGNRFETYEQCMTACRDVCRLPKDAGSCSGDIISYYYDIQSHECKQFNYGGCGGNANRFATLNECNWRCAPLETFPSETCKLPADTGPCKAYIPMFFYNAAKGDCGRFICGGRHGNANKFESYDECMAACGDICVWPKEPGPCFAYIPNFCYDTASKQCKTSTVDAKAMGTFSLPLRNAGHAVVQLDFSCEEMRYLCRYLRTLPKCSFKKVKGWHLPPKQVNEEK